MTAAGSLRPSPVDGFTPAEEAQLVAACPGAVAEARVEAGCRFDPVWGAYRSMARAWAAHSDVRHEGATGGVLTALGMHALRTGRVDFVLHVGADPDRPMRSRWVLSDTPESVQANTASRYGPTCAAGRSGDRAGEGTALRHHRQALRPRSGSFALHDRSSSRRTVHHPPGAGVRGAVAAVEVAGGARRVRAGGDRGGAVPVPGPRQPWTDRGGDPGRPPVLQALPRDVGGRVGLGGRDPLQVLPGRPGRGCRRGLGRHLAGRSPHRRGRGLQRHHRSHRQSARNSWRRR